MSEELKTVLFKLDERTFALHLEHVDRIVRAVEVTPLPKTPEIVLGIINVHGEIIPIVDIRKRFSLLPKKTSLTDQIVIVKTSHRKIGFFADSAEGYKQVSSGEVVHDTKIWEGIEYVDGVVRISDELVLINNLEKFLMLEEENQIDVALKSEIKNKSKEMEP
jgi:purine-binding chemotaxis protein CheW